MDSGNSGSMQSSSGGDEEYDSRAESISSFLSSNNNPLSHVGPLPNPQPPPPDHQHHHSHQTLHSSSSSMVDPFSNYFDPLSASSSRSPPLTNPNSLLNFDMVWSKNLRSEPNCTDLAGFIASSSPTQQFFTNQTQARATFPSMQIPQGQESATRGPGSGSGSNDQASNNSSNNTIARNPKKRSRASRRAPTTVLTTDTTNFRAMVQEFTGIPAPPFTSSPFPRSRLDLFGTTSTLRSATSHLDAAPPPYLLRPFAQKLQPPPPLPFASPPPPASTSFSTSSMVDAIASTTITNINTGASANTATSNSSTSINYQLPSDLGLLKQPQNLPNINVQNPMLNFHPFLQAPTPKYPPIFGTTTKPSQGSLDIPSSDSHLKIGILEEFGLSHGHVNADLSGIQNIVSSSDTVTLRRSDNNPGNWGDGEGDHHHQCLLRTINGNYNNSSSQRGTNGKVVNFSASSSDFRGDKGPEIVAATTTTRSEGMMESWICSSD